MLNSSLHSLSTTYIHPLDRASGAPTLRDTCAALLSHTILSSSDLISGPAGFTLHPHLAIPLRRAISALQLVHLHVVDSVDLHIVLGPSPDWRVMLEWEHLVKQLRATMLRFEAEIRHQNATTHRNKAALIRQKPHEEQWWDCVARLNVVQNPQPLSIRWN
ncbi:hypothetical protein B0H13DRAFT_2324353 [Mycena leptocephala]|nr:hypothetical protein B0H13DRAFT_2324353 [Mycena leptocephala]